MPYAYAPADTVIAQNPAPDAAGVESPTVSLLVAIPPLEASSGVVMPDFAGQSYSAASAAISHAGLKLTPVKTVSADIPAIVSPTDTQAPQLPVAPGTVTGQNPPAGDRVDASTPIELTVAQ
jgi:beta-lactam-binding protein with PASTA domain